MCLSIHPCICPSLCSSSHPSIYLAIHEFIWTWTFLAIFRSSDPCVHRSFHLIVDLFLYPATHLSIYLSICLCIHRSSCPSIYRFSYQIPLHLSPVVLQKPMPARAPTALFSFVGLRLHDPCRRQNGCKTQTLHGWVRKNTIIPAFQRQHW